MQITRNVLSGGMPSTPQPAHAVARGDGAETNSAMSDALAAGRPALAPGRTALPQSPRGDRVRVGVFGEGPPWPPAIAQMLAGTPWCVAESFPGPTSRDRTIILPVVEVAVVVGPRDTQNSDTTASADAWIRMLHAQRISVIWMHDGAAPDAGGQVLYAERDIAPERLRGMVETLARLRPAFQEIDRQLVGVHELGQQLRKHFDDIQRELTLAARLQRDFLPRDLPESPGLTFATLYRPCNWVSGDMFDVFRIDDRRIGFYLVDAMGHGVSAALLTMFVRNAIRLARGDGDSMASLRPGEVLGRLNHSLLAEHLPDCQFLTGWYGVLDTQSLELTYANGGHPPAVWRHAGGEFTALAGEGGLLGVFPTMSFTEQSVRLQRGDRLLLYSDGVEPLITAPEEGPAPVNLKPQVAEMLALPAADFVQDIAMKLDEMPGAFSSRLDDVTMVVVDLAP